MRNDLVPLNGRLIDISRLQGEIHNLVAGSGQHNVQTPVQQQQQQAAVQQQEQQPAKVPTTIPTQTCGKITRVRENADGSREVEIRENLKWYY